METQNLRLPVERVYREEKQGWEAVIPEGFHWLPNEESHFFWLQPPDSSKDLGFMAVFTPQEIASPLSQTDLLQVLRAAAHEMTAELGWGSTPVEAKFSHTAFGDGVELSGQGPAEGKRIGTFRVFAVSLCSGRAAILFGAGWIREKEGAILNRFADSVRPIADGELPLCALKHR